ncbi:hypothetical protein MPSEU_000782900 [Mayamaea pseudoterrestris]|nr:hypothetical protein MPSEU_000782900 [Mayamaea pseudoterrestris]
MTRMYSLLIFLGMYRICQGFSLISVRDSSRSKQPLTVRFDQETVGSDATAFNLNASNSFGSLLLQMQTQEKSLMARNKSMETLDLNGLSSSRQSNATDSQHQEDDRFLAENDESEQQASVMDSMDYSTAKSLDDAVTRLAGDVEFHKSGVEVLPLDPLYQTQQQSKASTTTRIATLKQPEKHQGRIMRDRRLTAASITASMDTPAQWRLFCQEGGGLVPLLETIREGARSVMLDHSSSKDTTWLQNHHEEAIIAASNACRSIRDVCAVSPEIAAIVTDGMLRVNAAWAEDGGLLGDFCTLLEYANDYTETKTSRKRMKESPFRLLRRNKREARVRCLLYVSQLLLAMTFASDDAIVYIRKANGLSDAILACSSYARKEKRRRWLRYPGEVVRYLWRKEVKAELARNPFLEAAKVKDTLEGQVQKTANLVLAAIGSNQWVPKIPGQRGLRILCLDGGGSRGISAVTALNRLIEYAGGGSEPADSFDIICGTSTGGIISFLTGLRGETSQQAVERYNQLIKQIFVKSALSTTRMLLTTASYDESAFMDILHKILGDATMLDSRSDPSKPLVFCVTSKMSSTPTHVSLFRNYNYKAGELSDHFVIDPQKAREEIGIPLEQEDELIRCNDYARSGVDVSSPGLKKTDGSRHPGSFRVLQRYALRASTAAPTVFKPVMMQGEMYCDGGIVASNPSAIAIHEARTLFPDVPIEMVVSIGTGAFLEQKSSPRIGWDGIIGQIVGSACDGEQIHHILEDILGDSTFTGRGSSLSQTRYYRFNPVIGLPDAFPIDVTDPEKLRQLREITLKYMDTPTQRVKMDEIASIFKGRKPAKQGRLRRLLSNLR